MFFTERELTLTVAFIPLLSGLLVARHLDNRNEKRKTIEIRRLTYANLLASIEEIADFVEGLRDEPGGLASAYTAMSNSWAMMDLVAPKEIHQKGLLAFEIAQISRASTDKDERLKRSNFLNELTNMMRKDLGYQSDDIIQDVIFESETKRMGS